MESNITKRVKSLSRSKNRKNSDINPKILKIYGQKSNQPNKSKTNKDRLKLKCNIKQRRNTSTYEFPEFQISYKEDTNRSHIVQDRIKEDKKQKMQKLRSPADEKYIQYEQQQISTPQKYTKIEHSRLDKCEKLSERYISAVKKVFKSLDIFNRGTISEVNINKWVPQSALYFLGAIFQNIRLSKMTVNLDQFIKMCEPLFYKSNQLDILQFIASLNRQNSQKCSIISPDQFQLSPIQKRMLEEQIINEKLGSCAKSKHLDHVLSSIQNRQKQVMTKIQNIKYRQKAVPMTLLSQSNPNQSMVEIRKSKNSIRVEEQTIKSVRFADQICQSIKTRPFEYKDQIQQNCEEFVPNFTFQIPNQLNQRPLKKENIPSVTYQKYIAKRQDNSQFELNRISNRPSALTSRRAMQISQLNSSNVESISDSRRYQYRQESDKIDKLNSKLEEYLKSNKSKMQKSKLFMQENNYLQY